MPPFFSLDVLILQWMIDGKTVSGTATAHGCVREEGRGGHQFHAFAKWRHGLGSITREMTTMRACMGMIHGPLSRNATRFVH
jgi:hypothetical protein